MGTFATVIFSDLTGSTGVFETLGDQEATLAVRRLTQLMGQACEAHQGRVVKTLGDGVLAVFSRESDAVEAMVDLQRQHRSRTAHWPRGMLMQIKVGMASGQIVVLEGDCYGEAVNLASRLCDLSGPGEVWATSSVVEPLQPAHGVRFRPLGPIGIRGLAEPREVCQIDWDLDDATDMMTLAAPLGGLETRRLVDPVLGLIKLSWLDVKAAFRSADLPIHLGRLSDAEFAVNDPRVSRRHARIDWVDGNFVMTDLSSYGTWVRFPGGSSELALRRSECVLMEQGEISLGAPFTDFTAPVVSFTLADGGVALAHQRKR